MAVVLQHVDDILLCAETEEACSEASEDVLNFLAGCGYKASREKAQLCQQFVKYLGLIISDGEDNGTPLQYSCLENPMDGGTW